MRRSVICFHQPWHAQDHYPHRCTCFFTEQHLNFDLLLTGPQALSYDDFARMIILYLNSGSRVRIAVVVGRCFLFAFCEKRRAHVQHETTKSEEAGLTMNSPLNEYELAFLRQFSNSDWIAARELPRLNQSIYDESISVKPKNGENNGFTFKIVFITSTFDFLNEDVHVLEIKYSSIGGANITSTIANLIAQTVKNVAIQNNIHVIHIRFGHTIFNQSGFNYRDRSFYWIGDKNKIQNELLRQAIQEDGLINSELAEQQMYVDYFSRIVRQYMTITDTQVIGKTMLQFNGHNGDYFHMDYRSVPISPKNRGLYLSFEYKQVDGEPIMRQILKEITPFAKTKGHNHYKDDLFGLTRDCTVKLNAVEQAMLRVYQSLGFKVQLHHQNRYGEDDRSWYSVSKQLY